MEDPKRNRFLKLVEKRVNKAIHSIDLVGNLSNISHYSYTDEECEKIIGALSNSLNNVKKKFSESNLKKNQQKFKL